MTAVAIAAILGLSAQARAEGALAVGCTSDGTIVWGLQFGESSVETAESKALQRCQAQGSDCTLFRAALHGDGAWIALSTDPTVPAPQCLPVGEYYSASKETAEKMAVAACQKNGGRNCEITFIQQNKGQTIYTIIPGTGGATGGYKGFTPQPTPSCNDIPIMQRYGSGCQW
jgi:hypothetical protein